MNIQIEDLKFKAIIGILDFERKEEQDVIVDLVLCYNNEDDFIDYALVVEFIKKHIKKSKFLLIEDALDSLSKRLKEKFPLINSLDLKISKPSILPDAKVSVSNTYSFDS